MSTYAFELSGEHKTLPKSEAIALVQIFSSNFRELFLLDQCLVIEASDLDVSSICCRLAMSHRIIEVLSICDAKEDALIDAARKMHLPLKSYMIRARRIQDSSPKADFVEQKVGSVLYHRGFRVNLEDPEVILRAIITSGKIVLGLEVASIDRSSFERRRPHLKPFFHPGVLMPRMARALINLSRARSGEWLLDPFAGTGGILVEACLICICGLGIEVQARMIRGASSNVEDLSCELMMGDAKQLPLKESSIDSAVMDIPYGRSAKIEAHNKEQLLVACLPELNRVIKPKRYMVIVADQPIDHFLENANFKVMEEHTDRIHKSLTRHIFVCQKI